MTKWECCAVVGMDNTALTPGPYHPAIWFFTPERTKRVERRCEESTIIAQQKARLGEHGCETMVAAQFPDNGSLRIDPVAIYFKRAKE